MKFEEYYTYLFSKAKRESIYNVFGQFILKYTLCLTLISVIFTKLKILRMQCIFEINM